MSDHYFTPSLLLIVVVISVAALVSVMTVAIVLCVGNSAVEEQHDKGAKKRSRRSIFAKGRFSKRGEVFQHPLFLTQREHLGVSLERIDDLEKAEDHVKPGKAENGVMRNGKVKKPDNSKEKKPQQKGINQKDLASSTDKKTNPPSGKTKDPKLKHDKGTADITKSGKEKVNVTQDVERNEVVLRNKHLSASCVEPIVQKPAASETISLTTNNAYGSNPNVRPNSAYVVADPEKKEALNKRVSLPVKDMSFEQNPSYLQLPDGSSNEELEYSYVPTTIHSKSSTFPMEKSRSNNYPAEAIGIYVEMDMDQGERASSGNFTTSQIEEDTYI